MKKSLRQAISSIIAMVTVATSMASICAFANENAANNTYITCGEAMIQEERSVVTYYNYTYNLYSSAATLLADISAPSNSAAIFDMWTKPTGGGVQVYICPYTTLYPESNYYKSFYFDTSGYAPVQSFSIAAGTTYYVYLKKYVTNTVSGKLDVTKTTA